LWGIAFLAGYAQLLHINFLATLITCGFVYAFSRRGYIRIAFGLAAGFAILSGFYALSLSGGTKISPSDVVNASRQIPALATLFFSGLRAGLLTFGGAYTAIPFIQHDAVDVGRWMTGAQFLDGLALSGLLPAPLIIFSTFVGYIGGGPLGAIVLTIGVFFPAFAFTMIGHDYLERLVENTSAHAFLDGVTAGVVGLIAATALGILNETIVGLQAWIVFGLALIVLFRSKAKWAIAAVVVLAGIFGYFFMR
jgi:chromate transporter